MACVTHRHNNGWLEIDTSHPAYPRDPSVKEVATTPVLSVTPSPSSGPGTELKALLKVIGITSSPGCSCNARAAQMDAWGADECERRIPEIVGWLGEEARKRSLPFVPFAGEQVVKLAIRRARKAAAG